MRIFPRPRPREAKPRRNDIEVIQDKVTCEPREICHGKSWNVRREEVWERDRRRCLDCNQPVPLHHVKRKDGQVIEKAAEIHHKTKRGMGGGKRDDRKENLATLCWQCHDKRERFGEPEDRKDVRDTSSRGLSA